MHQDPAAYWNDVAGRWVRVQAGLDAWIAPITAQLLRAAAAQPAERVIDVGCGGGTTTLALAERVGAQGRVLGVDISRPMIDYAKERSTGVPQVEYALADATEHPFESSCADLVTSRFGVMFFLDPVRAFANLHASLRPGGRMVIACWRRPELNPWITYGMQALPELTPALPEPEDGPGPFSLSDEARVRQILAEAGFCDVELEPFSAPIYPGETVEAAIELMTEIGPLSRALAEADEAAQAEMTARVRAHLERDYRDGPPAADSSTWLIHARA